MIRSYGSSIVFPKEKEESMEKEEDIDVLLERFRKEAEMAEKKKDKRSVKRKLTPKQRQEVKDAVR